ncbi:hypothetical protein J1N35_013543 [Gossypium stocksii]|uniref:Uncharacterized protein n=1 Tax=Gossypium stocksii TaxID=47602 RepID=A0A9D4A943_9ROSI|nr:hypothetical protein J1N35_013543 [Gossypium stocksii]
MSKLKWGNFCAHYRSYSPFLLHKFYANLYDQDLKFIFIRKGLLPWDANTINELHNLTVDVNEHSDFFTEVMDKKMGLLVQDLCIEGARWTGSHPRNLSNALPFLNIAQQNMKGIVLWEDENIIENKGSINETSIKRMTRGTETPILKEARTNMTKKDKAKANSKGTTLHIETSLWHKIKDIEKIVTSISNRDIEECLHKIDSLFEDGIFADQEDTGVEKEIDASEEEVVVEAEVVAEEEQAVENEKEKAEKILLRKLSPHLDLWVPILIIWSKLEQDWWKLLKSPVRGNAIHGQ